VNIQQVSAIKAIIESGLNLAEAADYMGLSATGLGKQVRRLEGELGFPIFSRRGKRLTGLTANGEQAIAIIEVMLIEHNKLILLSRSLLQKKERLNLSISMDLMGMLGCKFIMNLIGQMPDLTIDLNYIPPREVSAFLLTGRGSFALSAVEQLQPELECLKISSSPIVALVRKVHPLAGGGRILLSDLGRYAIAAHPAFGATLAPLDAPPAELSASKVITPDPQLICGVLRESDMVGFLPRCSVPGDGWSDLVEIEVDADLGHQEIWLCSKRAAQPASHSTALREALARQTESAFH
jgi:DNA-binding transcriptional LysR family regulator